MSLGMDGDAPMPLERLVIERTVNGFLVTEAKPFRECGGKRWVATDACSLAALVRHLVAPGDVEPTIIEQLEAARRDVVGYQHESVVLPCAQPTLEGRLAAASRDLEQYPHNSVASGLVFSDARPAAG